MTPTSRPTAASRRRFQAQIAADPKLKKNADDPVDRLHPVPGRVPDRRTADQRRLPQGDLLRDQQGRPAAGPRWHLRPATIAPSMTPPGIPGHEDPTRTTRTRTARTTPVTWPRPRTSCSSAASPTASRSRWPTSPVARPTRSSRPTQQALERVGINVTPLAGDAGVVLLDVHRVAEQRRSTRGIGMAQAGWGADFPTLHRLLRTSSHGTPSCRRVPATTRQPERPEGRRRCSTQASAHDRREQARGPGQAGRPRVSWTVRCTCRTCGTRRCTTATRV